MSRKRAYVPRRCDVMYLNLDPQAGHEQAGRRPVFVLSPDAYNRPTGLAVICPITNQAKGHPFELPIPPNDLVSGVILADQVKCLDWQARRPEFICTLGEELAEEVIQLLLALIDPEGEEDEG
jgi:mRNA interferase MazF